MGHLNFDTGSYNNNNKGVFKTDFIQLSLN